MSPYVIVAIAAVLGVALSVIVRGRPIVTRFGVGLAFWALATAALVYLVGSPLNPIIGGDQWANVLQRLFVAGWWLLTARLAVLGSVLWYGARNHYHQARLTSDLASAILYVGAILVILDKVFDVAVTGLVATSGIIAIVLGLALQNTLGDLFSGIAIGLERPFMVGDRIWIEGSIEGSVVETNWRSTRIATDSNDIATVPNSVIAKARILNRSRPTEVRTDTIHLFLDPKVSPERGIALLEAAAKTTSGIATEPAVVVVCTELRGEGTRYAIQFSAPRRELARTRSHLFEAIARHALFGGVALATENNLPLTARRKPTPAEVVCEFDLLADCLPEEREILASSLIARHGGKDELLVAQKETRTSLFLIVSGLFEILHDYGEGPVRVGMVGPGDHVGELSLLAGEPSQGTLKAMGAFLVYELTKDSLAPVMRQNPRLVKALEAGALRVRARIDRVLTAHERLNHTDTATLMSRILAFFDMPQ